MVESLRKQIDTFQLEHACLKNEIISLVQDNRALSLKLASSLDCSRCGSSIHIPADYQDSKITLINETLKRQLDVSLKEKDSAVELWENSLKIIDQLERELSLYENNTSLIKKSDHNRVKQRYVEQVHSLETQLKTSQTQLTETIKSSTENLTTKNTEISKVLEQQLKASAGIHTLEEEVKYLGIKLNDLRGHNESLLRENEEKDKLIRQLTRNNTLSKDKVSEAVDLIESAILEKDAALLREKAAKIEIENLQKILAKIIDEAGEKVVLEVESVKANYETKTGVLQDQINKLQSELSHRKIEIETQSDRCKKLENDLHEYKYKPSEESDGSNQTKILLLEKNLEGTFQKMLISDRKNIQLQAQCGRIREEQEQNLERFKIELERKENDKRVLQYKVRKLKNELQISNAKLLQVAEKVEEVNERIKMMESEIKKETVVKDIKSEQMVCAKIREIEITNQKLLNDLMNQLENQIEINKAWRRAVPDLTEKIEKRHNELRDEIAELKKANKDLKEQLHYANERITEYQTYMGDLHNYFKTLPTEIPHTFGDAP